jgi:PAS domain S-box-containing protein
MPHTISKLLVTHIGNAVRSTSGGLGFSVLNPEGEILEFSQSLCEILDVETEIADFTSLSDFFITGHSELIRSSIEHCAHKGISSCDVKLSSKTDRWLRILLLRIDDEVEEENTKSIKDSSATLALIYNCTDVQTQELRFEEQRDFLRQVLDINPSFIFAKDREGRFTLVNEAIARVYGTTVEKLIGKTDADFNTNEEEVRQFRKDDLEVMDRLLEKRIDAEPVTDSAGETRWMQTVKRPIIGASGRADQLLGVSTDITERRFAEQMLQDIAFVVSSNIGEDLFQSILENLLSTFIEVELVVLLRFASSQANQTCTARSRNNVDVGSGIEVHDKLLTELSAEKIVWVEGGIDAFVEGPSIPRDGFFCAIEVPGETGSPRGVLLAFGETSVVRKSALESALHIFAARTASELERIQSEASRREMEQGLQHTQKLESLGVLAGGIAHDFNNLLMAMLGNASLALHDCRDDSPLVPRLKNIKKSAERASILTNQLLAYSGKATLQKSQVNLSLLVEEMGELLHTALSKGAVLDMRCEPNLPLIEADTAQLQQIVMNCITNASDALDGSLGTIRVRTSTGRFEPAPDSWSFVTSSVGLDEGVILEVSDPGQGMSEETISHIFDPFFTTKFTGRGLGLAAVLGIVRGHDGAIEVKSKEGVGSEFRIFFPVSKAVSPRLVSDISVLDNSMSWKGEGEVLVVDDERPVRTVACSLLEALGFQTVDASGGPKALEILRADPKRFSAVLLDMTMPEMSGVEVHTELKKLNPNLPVLISSGYAEHRSALGVLRDEDGFLQKPYTLIQLMKKMRMLLDS